MMILTRLMVSNISGWIISIKYPKISSPDYVYDGEQATQAKGNSNGYTDD